MPSKDRWAYEVWYVLVAMGQQPIVIGFLIVVMVAMIATRHHR